MTATPPATSAETNSDIDIDTLQAWLFCLMTHYSESRSEKVATAVFEQMQRLLQHPLIELLPAQRAALAGLAKQWQARRMLPPAATVNHAASDNYRH